MFNYWRKKKQIIAFCLIFFISFLGVFTLGANEAKASFKGDIGGMLGELLLMVQRGVGKITVLLATFSEGILKYTKIQSAEIVTDGWKTVRDLVNMLFILVLLVIAFATILRLENYGMKTLLPKLIGTALLINFSLILAGAVIDFSGVLTDFFIKEDFSINITHKMGLSSTIKSDAGTAENVGEERWRLCETTLESKWASGCQETVYSSEEACEEAERTFSLYDCVNQTRVSWSNVVDTGKYWDVILAIVFSIVFNIIAAFVFGALAFLLLVRVLAIWFLLILAPLAWFFWILPATKGLFTKWWDNFIKWVFFAPAVTFFIWLSITSWEKLISGRTVLVGDPIAAEMMNIPAMPIMPDVLKPGAFVQFFLICGMLIGSLIVAQKIGVYGANGAIDLGKRLGKGVGKWTARKGQRVAYRPLGATGRGLNKASAWMRKSGLGRWTGASQLVGQAGRAVGALGGKEIGKIKESEEKYKGRTSDSLKSIHRLVDGRDKAAIASILAGRGDLEKNDKLGFTENDIQKSTKLAKRYGSHSDILKARPDLSPNVNVDINSQVSKIKPADIEKLQAYSLKSPRGEDVKSAIVGQLGENGRWRSNHLAKSAETNPELAKELREILKSNFGSFREDVKEYLRGDAAKTIFGEIAPPKKKASPDEEPKRKAGFTSPDIK